MPGVSKDHLSIQADRNNLTIEGEAAIDLPAGMEALYADLQSTRYRRSFLLSGNWNGADRGQPEGRSADASNTEARRAQASQDRNPYGLTYAHTASSAGRVRCWDDARLGDRPATCICGRPVLCAHGDQAQARAGLANNRGVLAAPAHHKQPLIRAAVPVVRPTFLVAGRQNPSEPLALTDSLRNVTIFACALT